MKNLIILSLLFCFSRLEAQNVDKPWEIFWEEESTLAGFKNADGEVMVPPKFMGFTVARKFENVIAVMEEKNGEFISYHLTRSGKTFGRDSLYISDNSADCESEGFIRFQVNEKVGMFSSDGKVVIPAEYNALSQVMNGFVIALKGAKKSYWDKNKHSGCNHFSWKGGETMLLNTANNLLIKDFENEKQLDFYSVEKTQEQHPDPMRLNFRAEDGHFYSFIDEEKAFKTWLVNDLLNGITSEKLLMASNDTISYWDDQDGWLQQPKKECIANHFNKIKSSLLKVKSPLTDYFISLDNLIILGEYSTTYDKYFNNCGQAKYWQYPLFSIVIDAGEKENFTQDQIAFLKTDEGYRLIHLTLRNP